ncbi:hypothetical protein GCM10011517_03870 [Actibacterium pelagium]|uniref:Uncharacterized protein n=1 Tax=Actibacterium pelagium TaxID=2029103 RepID=A0A917EIA8_9RHOB|nr:hypothetical protein [Actibacterium pelagium]GGE39405.1 hypothetical protein GCM10011517_03870 [Actibacterium pelagium]
MTFGDASLVITDRSESPLTHWSLPALIRQNPGEIPALFIPGPDATESLEIDDETMIEAIETIQQAVSRRRPRPGRLRTLLSLAGILLIAGVLIFILPGVLIRHTATVAPAPLRAEIGQALLDRIGRVSGTACSTRAGTRSLNRLSRRLFSAPYPKITVLPAGIATTSQLPGGTLLVNRSLVEDFEDPEVLAGYLLAEKQRGLDHDPLLLMLERVGPIASFRLLTTGHLPDTVLDSYAETLVTLPNIDVSEDTLLAQFKDANLSSRPYAYAVDVSGETTLTLIEADPVGENGTLVLSDADWVQLQAICGE